VWDSDSEEDEIGGMSPPKTMQFHVPRERLLRTPGRFFPLPQQLDVGNAEQGRGVGSKRKLC